MAYLSLQKRAKADDGYQTALNILKWCSVLYPFEIRNQMLCSLTGYDEIKLNEGISKILSYSLIQRQGENELISIKEITQFLIQCELEPVAFQYVCESMGNVLQKEFLSNAAISCNIVQRQEFVQHARWMISCKSIADTLTKDVVSFLYVNIAEYELMQGDLKLAQTRFKYVIDMETPGTIVYIQASIMQALLYETEGKYGQAMEILENIALWQCLLKKENPIHYLQWKQLEAYLYEDFMMGEEAESSLNEAFAQLETCLPELPDEEAAELKMELLNIQGQVYSLKGEDQKAAQAYRDVLKIGENKFNENKEKIRAYIWAYGNLALTEMDQNIWSSFGASECFQKQGRWLQQFYHQSLHPDMVYQKYGLGRCYCAEEKNETVSREALKCFDEALKMLEDLGLKNHPLALQIHLEYEMCLVKKSQYEEAYSHGMAGLKIAKGFGDSKLKTNLQLMLFIYTGHAQLMLENYIGAQAYFKEARKLLFKPNSTNLIMCFLIVHLYLFFIDICKIGRLIVKVFKHSRNKDNFS